MRKFHVAGAAVAALSLVLTASANITSCSFESEYACPASQQRRANCRSSKTAVPRSCSPDDK